MTSLNGASRSPAGLSVEPTVEVSTLANGLRVATDAMPGLASAALGVWIGSGARHERDDENGIAHFLEHMAFKGTPTRTARRIAEEIEDTGGELNAYTSREITAYHARVLAEDVDRGFDILADILRNPLFAPDDIALEQGVILQEIGQALDTPDDVIFDWAQETAFPGQPLGRAILGSEASVRAVDAARLRRFMETRYTPERMVVAAAGAVDHARIVALAERAFGDLAAPASALAFEAAAYGGGERKTVKDLEQAHVVLGLAAPGYRDADYFAAQVHATLLGGGMSSRLFQEVREQRGLAYSIFAQSQGYGDGGMLTIYGGTGGESVAPMLEVVMREMRAAAEAATEAETARARAQIRAGLLMGLESPVARAERAARGLIGHGRIRRVEEVLDLIDAVDARRVRDFGAAALAAARPTLALYGPVAEAPSLEALTAELTAGLAAGAAG